MISAAFLNPKLLLVGTPVSCYHAWFCEMAKRRGALGFHLKAGAIRPNVAPQVDPRTFSPKSEKA
jgi:hypothetical protein